MSGASLPWEPTSFNCNQHVSLSQYHPRAADLPASTASTGLQCLLVGAQVHLVWFSELRVIPHGPTTHPHFSYVTCVPGWTPTEAMQSKTRVQTCLGCNPSLQVRFWKCWRKATHSCTRQFACGLRHLCTAGMA